MLSHLPRPKRPRLLAGAACLAVACATGVLAARQSEPLPAGAPLVADAAAAAPVADAPSTPAPAKPVAVAELTLARSVLIAIDADPVLKDVNLVVSVVDRGAVVGGPVTSEGVKKRVEAVVRGVPGVESVKNVCFVQADADTLWRAMAERLKPGAAAEPLPALPGVALAPNAPRGALPPPEPPAEPLVAAKPPNTVAARPPLGPVNVLGAPVAPAGPKAVAKITPLPPVEPPAPPPVVLPTTPGALTSSPSPAAPPADLRAAAVAVTQTDPRFARFTVEPKPDGALFVSGAAAAVADVRDFVAALRQLPGAGRVVVDPALVR
jgi:hypothetical protein